MTKDYKFLADPRPRRRFLPRLTVLAAGLALAGGGAYVAMGKMPLPDLSPDHRSADSTTEVLSMPLALPGQEPPAEKPEAVGESAPEPVPAQPSPEASSAPGPAQETGETAAAPAGPTTGETAAAPAGPTTGAPGPEDRFAPAPEDTDVAEAEAEAETSGSGEAGHWVRRDIRAGDSLARIFPEMGLSASLLHRIIHSGDQAATLADIRPGEHLRVRLDADGEFAELVLERSPVNSLRIVHKDGEFRTEQLERDVEERVAEIAGTIERSLYASALDAGLSDRLIMELANIFGWDIDFALEIRSGDQFRVVFQEEYLDGEKLADGPILAAEFVNRGRVIRAVRYQKEDGAADYYSPDGKSMRKAFLRAPVDFRRISSRFQRERYHPILGKKRPHRGVDYAANTGTPVRASGDGKVIHAGRKGGYGNTVIIQHGQQYTTLYGHLNGYRRGIRAGKRVKQGQIIGYVGMTGLATGPHLHYEFRVNGTHRDPLTVKLPEAEPIAARYREDFERKTAPLVAKLETLGKTMLAEAN